MIWSSILGNGKGVLSSPKHPDQLCDSNSLLYNGDLEFFM
jgi:hypothetical protein